MLVCFLHPQAINSTRSSFCMLRSLSKVSQLLTVCRCHQGVNFSVRSFSAHLEVSGHLHFSFFFSCVSLNKGYVCEGWCIYLEVRELRSGISIPPLCVHARVRTQILRLVQRVLELSRPFYKLQFEIDFNETKINKRVNIAQFLYPFCPNHTPSSLYSISIFWASRVDFYPNNIYISLPSSSLQEDGILEMSVYNLFFLTCIESWTVKSS